MEEATVAGSRARSPVIHCRSPGAARQAMLMGEICDSFREGVRSRGIGGGTASGLGMRGGTVADRQRVRPQG